jgi:hypothetical protein
MDKRAMGDRIIKRKRLFQMRPGRSKPAGKHKVSTGGVVTQNQPGGIAALTAQTQQILVQAQRQIEFPTDHMITRLPIGNAKELRRGTQLLPQLSCAGIGLACFRRRVAFDGDHHRA